MAIEAKGEKNATGSWPDYVGKIKGYNGAPLSAYKPTDQEVDIKPSGELDGFSGLSIGRLAKTKLNKSIGAVRELSIPTQPLFAMVTIVASAWAIVKAVNSVRVVSTGNPVNK